MGGLTHYKATELCRSDTSSKALFCGIRSRSKLKERRLISDSALPGGFAAFETDMEFVYICLRLHIKKDRLDPLSSVSNLTTEVGNHTPNCLDSLSSVVKMSTVESNRTVAHDVICYSLRGVMEIPRHSPHSKTNDLIDCIYHSQAPCRFTLPSIQGRMGSLPRSRSGAGWLSAEWSPLCRDNARSCSIMVSLAMTIFLF